MRVLELFAGYGSQALALENLGIEFTSDISEIDKYAIQAYNQLHGDTHNYGDITKIDEKKLPYYDLITYSSPCQDFSAAGLQKGGDAGSGTRSSLLWECERIIRAVKPKYLLMENVKNLVGEKHKHNFIRWLRVLEMMGYQNYWKVLNAKDYGVPQNRERVFVVSILGCGQYLFPNPVKLEKRLKDVLEQNVDEKYYLSDKLIQGFLHRQETNNNGFAKNGINVRNDKDYATALTARMAKCGMTDNYIKEPLACASRGRYPENPSNRTTGAPTEQRIEINETGCTNTLTSVQKDNYIIEPNILTPKRTEYGKQIRKEYESGTVKESRHNMTELEPRQDGISNTLTSVQKDNYVIVPEATKQGYAKAYDGDSINLDQPNSETRRGRVGHQMANTLICACNQAVVQQVGNIVSTGNWDNPERGRVYSDSGLSPTLNTMQGGGREPKILKNYRIRKLTPRECWRLMGVKDEQFNKLHDLSNTQLYKLAGNSIVVDVLMGIFKNLLLSDEGTKGQLTLF